MHAAIAAAGPKKGVEQAQVDEALARLDRMREGAALLIGALSRYLPRGSPLLVKAIEALVKAVATDSVQRSVASCLQPLVSAIEGARQGQSPFMDKTVTSLTSTLFQGKVKHERRGAAAALAAIMKGLGGPALRKYEIIEQLSKQASAKPIQRVGAMLGYAALFDELGPVLAPFVTRALASIVPCFGEPEAGAREAAHEAASAIMRHLDGTGVKLVLPIVLAGLSDRRWRTKVDAIELLGSMSNLAPRELSACLPQVVPNLLEAMSDANLSVQAAARAALTHIVAVIRNPEIRRLSALVLKALLDPASQANSKALMELVSTTFRHFVDPPSLALVIPIVRHGLRDRDGRTKKTAAQIAGSLAQIVSSKALILEPYASMLLRHLKVLLMDSSPDCRKVTARAVVATFRSAPNPEFMQLQQLLLSILAQEDVRIPLWAIRSSTRRPAPRVCSVLGVHLARQSSSLCKVSRPLLPSSPLSPNVCRIRAGRFARAFSYSPTVCAPPLAMNLLICSRIAFPRRLGWPHGWAGSSPRGGNSRRTGYGGCLCAVAEGHAVEAPHRRACCRKLADSSRRADADRLLHPPPRRPLGQVDDRRG